MKIKFITLPSISCNAFECIDTIINSSFNIIHIIISGTSDDYSGDAGFCTLHTEDYDARVTHFIHTHNITVTLLSCSWCGQSWEHLQLLI